MFALLERRDPTGPVLVHELFDEDPKLNPALKVVEVPKGVVVGWMQKPDGTFGPFVPPLDVAKAARLRTIRFDCFHEIIGGFTSSALGAPHRYGSSDTDQTNLDRAALASITGGDAWTAQIQCAPEGGDVAFVAHKAKQVHQVVADLHAHIEGARVKRDGLNGRIEAAKTAAEVEAVVWGQ